MASAGARPDRATLSLGVQARRASAADAMGRAAERAQALIDALRQAGADDADLRTTGLNLWFDQSERAYVAGTSLTVDVGVDDVGRHLDVAARAAGDDFTLNGVSFTVSDPAAVLAPLRELALADARAKATALAAAEGAGVGDVLAIVEGGGAPSRCPGPACGRWRRCRSRPAARPSPCTSPRPTSYAGGSTVRRRD